MVETQFSFPTLWLGVVLCACWTGCSIGNNDGHWDVDRRFDASVQTHPANMDTQVRHRYEILAFVPHNVKLEDIHFCEDQDTNDIIHRIDVSEHPELVLKWEVVSVPTFIFLKDGVERGRQVALHPK